MPNVMAAQPNISGALCESSVIPFLVPRRKVWLRPAAGVTRTQDLDAKWILHVAKFCHGAKAPKMYIKVYQLRRQPKIVQSWPPVSDVAAVTKPRREICQNLLWCPKLVNRSQPLVGRSSPYCEDIWKRYRRLTSFFPIVDTCLSCEDTARQSCAMVPTWRIFGHFCVIYFQRAACSTFQTCILNSH